MIKRLTLENVGPAPKLEVEEFGSRLNLVTGDNGLGKTFLLDACWYALTRTWADGKQFYPPSGASKTPPPTIGYDIIEKTEKGVHNRATFQFRDQRWVRDAAYAHMPGLVIYARVDGGFSIWDPARNYWSILKATKPLDFDNAISDPDYQSPQHLPAFQFSNSEVWNGLEEKNPAQTRTICNGLLRDVETWRLKGNGPFQLLQNILRGISPGEDESLSIGESVRVQIRDLRDIPTIKMPYGVVPVTQAAAGMRRVLALAYMLVWAWDEHCRASELQKEPPTNRFVLLFDEIEAHLHPKWQRVFLPSLISVVNGLLAKGQSGAIASDPIMSPSRKMGSVPKNKTVSVQIIATTHAPLVLASSETIWDKNSDTLFDFNLDANGRVRLEEVEYAKHGSAVNWLTSESFDLKSAYSVTAERAMEHADAFMRRYTDSESAPLEEKKAIHTALTAALGPDDEYWPYWLPYYEATRGTP